MGWPFAAACGSAVVHGCRRIAPDCWLAASTACFLLGEAQPSSAAAAAAAPAAAAVLLLASPPLSAVVTSYGCATFCCCAAAAGPHQHAHQAARVWQERRVCVHPGGAAGAQPSVVSFTIGGTSCGKTWRIVLHVGWVAAAVAVAVAVLCWTCRAAAEPTHAARNCRCATGHDSSRVQEA